MPEISPVKPTEGLFSQTRFRKIYSQEVGRGYSDGHGNIVMLLVAYGPVQNYRLKSHRPEICYTANGFRISEKTEAAFSYRDGSASDQNHAIDRATRICGLNRSPTG